MSPPETLLVFKKKKKIPSVSNNLDPKHYRPQCLVGPHLSQTICKGFNQQITVAYKGC